MLNVFETENKKTAAMLMSITLQKYFPTSNRLILFSLWFDNNNHVAITCQRHGIDKRPVVVPVMTGGGNNNSRLGYIAFKENDNLFCDSLELDERSAVLEAASELLSLHHAGYTSTKAVQQLQFKEFEQHKTK